MKINLWIAFCIFIIGGSTLGSELAYLRSKPFAQRQEKALSFIAECDTIIEIGGAGTPIDTFMKSGQKTIIVIDPEIKEKKEKNVEHVRKKFEEWQQPDFITANTYAVLIFGLALNKMPDNAWNKLYELINNSYKTVIEYSSTYKPAKSQIKAIKKNISKECTHEELDVSCVKLQRYKEVHPLRTICFFK